MDDPRNQPATGYGLQRSAAPNGQEQGPTGGGAGSYSPPATGYGMEMSDNAGSERTAPFESQYVQHIQTADAIMSAQLAIERAAEGQLSRVVDALVDILNPEYRSRIFPVTSTTAANFSLNGPNSVLWELPLEGQWTIDRIQLLTADGASYPDYARVDIPDIGTPIYLNSSLTFIEPRMLVYGNQRVLINSVSATAKNGIVLIGYRRVAHLGRRRQWSGEF